MNCNHFFDLRKEEGFYPNHNVFTRTATAACPVRSFARILECPLARPLFTTPDDPSDKLPGAPGVGPTGAAAIMRQYGSLEAALKAGRFSSLADKPRLYRSIATMNPKAPLPSLRDQKPTWKKAVALARDWELNNLADRLEELDASGADAE